MTEEQREQNVKALLDHFDRDADQVKAEFMKLMDDMYEGRYPFRFEYLCRDCGISQEYIDHHIRRIYEHVSQQANYNQKRKWD